MKSNPDYQTIRSTIDVLIQLGDDTTDTLSKSFTETSQIVYDHQTKCIVDDTLVDFIKSNGVLGPFLKHNTESVVPVGLYVLLYVHTNFKANIGVSQNYKDVLATIKTSPLYRDAKIPNVELEFFSLVYCIMVSNVEWNEFTSSFDGKDWSEIHLFQLLLPIGKLTLDDFCNWITKVSKEQENDGPLYSVAESIKKFIVESTNTSEVEANIKRFATEQYLSSFFPAVLIGLKTKQGNPNSHYFSLIKSEINSSTCYNILFGIGKIYEDDEAGGSEYFSIIDTHYRDGTLELKGYLALCTNFNFYSAVVYSTISSNLANPPDSSFANVLIRYLYNAPNHIDLDWLTSTLLALFTINEPSIVENLDSLLIKISESNIDLAFTILENRLRKLGGNNLLENVIVAISHKNQHLFQTKFITWLNSDDAILHVAIGRLTLVHSLNRKLFYIPKDICDALSLPDKLFVVCKSIGYIHSMEALQEIFISLIKSVTVVHETFKEQISYLLIDYLIYNYRGTLKLIENELKQGSLLPFAEVVFKDAVDNYGKYFDQLKNITIKKELSAPKHLMQLKSFYQRKQFETVSKNTRKGFLQGFFNNVYLNSNKWAIRRPNELLHVVSELGTVSASMEFPSGEILDPFHQEFIRRYYQKIVKHEINID